MLQTLILEQTKAFEQKLAKARRGQFCTVGHKHCIYRAGGDLYLIGQSRPEEARLAVRVPDRIDVGQPIEL